MRSIFEHPRHDRTAQSAERGRGPDRRRLIRTTLTEMFGPINAANLKQAHALIESGKARGKIVLTGF